MPSDLKTAVERFRVASQEWGARPGTLEGIFIAAASDVIAALETTRDLPMDQIRADMRRAASAGLADAAKALRRSQDWRMLAISSCVIVVALVAAAAGGYALGYGAGGQAASLAATDIRGAFQSGPAGAEWLASMVRNNDLSQLAGACSANAYKAAGGQACRVNLWTERTVAR
jgi:hypothetical protein